MYDNLRFCCEYCLLYQMIKCVQTEETFINIVKFTYDVIVNLFYPLSLFILFSAILEDCKFDPDRIEAFIKAFEVVKQELRAVLSNIGSQFPHIVDVDWRLDYYLKVKSC